MRYAAGRTTLSAIDTKGWKKLRTAHVLVAGVNGLGNHSSVFLSSAGIGHLTIVDPGRVEGKDILYHPLFHETDMGKQKAQVAEKRLSEINPLTQVRPLSLPITRESVSDMMDQAHIIVDGTDTLATRFLLNRACQDQGLPFIYGGVCDSKGAVMTIIPGKTPCLACFLSEAKNRSCVLPAAGPLLSLIASIQVMEVLKLIFHQGESLAGRLLVFEENRTRFQIYRIKKKTNCMVCSGIRSPAGDQGS